MTRKLPGSPNDVFEIWLSRHIIIYVNSYFVVCYYVTNHSKHSGLTQSVTIFHDSMDWLGGYSVVLFQWGSFSRRCSQIVAVWNFWHSLTHMSGTLVMIGSSGHLLAIGNLSMGFFNSSWMSRVSIQERIGAGMELFLPYFID